MNALKIFENKEFGAIRTVEENGNVLFCGSDVAKALGYVKPQNAIEAHCRYALKRGTPHPQSPDKEIEMLFIPEGDLYRLVANSKLPTAEKFEHWVFDEVLPSIRQHGAYMTPETIEKVLLNPDTIIGIATRLKEAQAQVRALEAKHEADKPKVLFADSVSASKSTILIGDLAKLIKQNGIDIGQKRLFDWMRANGYLIKQKGVSYNMPTQRAMDLELFEVKETSITHSDGHVTISRTVKVTGKGQLYFINTFVKETA